jgi:sorting nexin-1/2
MIGCLILHKRDVNSFTYRISKSANFLHSVSFQWEAKVERGQEEFDNISKMIKKEMERFEVNRVKDFKAIIMQYLENLMTHQQQVRDV